MKKITELPNELLFHVFSFLIPQELNTLSLVCKIFHKISQQDFFWKALLQNLKIRYADLIRLHSGSVELSKKKQYIHFVSDLKKTPESVVPDYIFTVRHINKAKIIVAKVLIIGKPEIISLVSPDFFLEYEKKERTFKVLKSFFQGYTNGVNNILMRFNHIHPKDIVTTSNKLYYSDVCCIIIVIDGNEPQAKSDFSAIRTDIKIRLKNKNFPITVFSVQKCTVQQYQFDEYPNKIEKHFDFAPHVDRRQDVIKSHAVNQVCLFYQQAKAINSLPEQRRLFRTI